MNTLTCKYYENQELKSIRSKNYNFNFDKNTGYFERYGKTKDSIDDPQFSLFGPEILDLEISAGKCSGNCSFCYKGNSIDSELHNMTFKQFKNIFHKIANTHVEIKFKDTKDKYTLCYTDSIGSNISSAEEARGLILNEHRNPDNVEHIKFLNLSPLTQIAFGICDIGTNPDFFKMMEYSRSFGIIPNYTCHGLDVTQEIANKTAEVCGAVAVSVYNKEKSYNAIKMFTDAGMEQVNIHYVLHDKSYEKAFSLLDDIKSDNRLLKLNAVVFLKYKPKGNNIGQFKNVLDSQFKELIEYAMERNINIGFDSCTAHSFLKAVKDSPKYSSFAQCAEPCESTCFSSYVNCFGDFYACSFCEGEGMWKEGISVLNSQNFLNDIWNKEKTNNFRKILLKNNRKCPMYKIDED